MKTSIQRWLQVAIALTWFAGGAVVAGESWDLSMQNRCQGNTAIQPPIDPNVAQGIGRCFLQLAQSDVLTLASQRHLALQYADSWFAYAAGEGLVESTQEWALTQNQLNQMTPVK